MEMYLILKQAHGLLTGDRLPSGSRLAQQASAHGGLGQTAGADRCRQVAIGAFPPGKADAFGSVQPGRAGAFLLQHQGEQRGDGNGTRGRARRRHVRDRAVAACPEQIASQLGRRGINRQHFHCRQPRPAP